MGKRIFELIVFIGMFSVILFSPGNAAEQVQVVVSIPPQTYFVKQIGGELVNVISMLPEGGFPHQFEPAPAHMKILSKAGVYVRINVEFENVWWDKIAAVNPNLHIVDSTQGVASIEASAQHDHDPHIWLSPGNVKILTENIYQGLVAVDPEHKDRYQTNKETFFTALDTLDKEIEKQLATLKTRKFMIFHPAWSHFAREYNLEQIPIEIEGKEPSAREMTELMKTARKEHITVVFVQPQTSRRSANTIARQLGAKIEILDPLAANWMENMRHVTKVLAEALSK